MEKKHKRRGVALWCTVAVVTALVVYPLSFGPACWWFSKPASQSLEPGFIPIFYAPRAYWPVGWAAKHGPAFVHGVIVWYATLFGNPLFAVPAEPSGDTYVFLTEPSFFR